MGGQAIRKIAHDRHTPLNVSGHRFRRPIEQLGMLIPFSNKLQNFRLHVRFRWKVCYATPLALEDTEPLLHLIHPGAVRGRKVQQETRVALQPLLDLFALVDAYIVTHHVNQGNASGNRLIEVFQERNELSLALAG
jgi:hypothetical protein